MSSHEASACAGPEGTSCVHYDLLIAADGRHSAVRAAFAAHDPSFSYSIKPSPLDYISFAGIQPPGQMRVLLGAGTCLLLLKA